MNQNLKRHLISAGITFASTFGLTLALAVQENSFTFSREALIALVFSALVAGVRAVAKIAVEWFNAS